MGKKRLGLLDHPSQTREAVSSTGSQETIFLAEEAVFRERRRRPEMITGHYRGQ
jgi:hypothetical protein